LEQACTSGADHCLRLILDFLCDNALVDSTAQGALVRARWKWRGYSRDFPSRLTGLNLTAMYWLLFLIEVLLIGMHKDGICGVGLKDSDGRTPLSCAAENGHEAVARLLVEQDDVETDSKDNTGRTPLSRATERGHKAIVRLLESAIATAPVRAHIYKSPCPPPT
jgi:hypothetical protein